MHIEWTEGRYGTLRGSAGDVELFSLCESTQRGVSAWELASDLPGTARHYGIDSAIVGKAMAENLFREFVERIGASLPKPKKGGFVFVNGSDNMIDVSYDGTRIGQLARPNGDQKFWVIKGHGTLLSRWDSRRGAAGQLLNYFRSEGLK